MAEEINTRELQKLLIKHAETDAQLAGSIAALAAVVALIPGVEKVSEHKADDIARSLLGPGFPSSAVTSASRKMIAAICEIAKKQSR